MGVALIVTRRLIGATTAGLAQVRRHGLELTPRSAGGSTRSWSSALALGVRRARLRRRVFGYFGELIMVFFLAWLLAFMLGPLVTRARRSRS